MVLLYVRWPVVIPRRAAEDGCGAPNAACRYGRVAPCSSDQGSRGSEANMGAPEKRRNVLWRWIRIVRARPRLFLTILLGLAIAAIAPSDWRPATRALAGWDIAVGVYLVLAVRLMTGVDAHHIRRR